MNRVAMYLGIVVLLVISLSLFYFNQDTILLSPGSGVVIDSISPTNVLIDSPISISVIGSGFTPDSKVTAAGVDIDTGYGVNTQFIDSMHLKLIGPSICGEEGIFYDGGCALFPNIALVVTASSGTSNDVPVTFDAPAPILQSYALQVGKDTTTAWNTLPILITFFGSHILKASEYYEGTSVLLTNQLTGAVMELTQKNGDLIYSDTKKITLKFIATNFVPGDYLVSFKQMSTTGPLFSEGLSLQIAQGCAYSPQPTLNTIAPTEIFNNLDNVLSFSLSNLPVLPSYSFYLITNPYSFWNFPSNTVVSTSGSSSTVPLPILAYTIPVGVYSSNVFGLFDSVTGCSVSAPLGTIFKSKAGPATLSSISPTVVPAVPITVHINGIGFYPSTISPPFKSSLLKFVDPVTGQKVDAKDLGVTITVYSQVIDASFPSTLAEGPTTVLVDNDGVYSNTFTFNIGAPVDTIVSPVTGSNSGPATTTTTGNIPSTAFIQPNTPSSSETSSLDTNSDLGKNSLLEGPVSLSPQAYYLFWLMVVLIFGSIVFIVIIILRPKNSDVSQGITRVNPIALNVNSNSEKFSSYA